MLERIGKEDWRPYITKPLSRHNPAENEEQIIIACNADNCFIRAYVYRDNSWRSLNNNRIVSLEELNFTHWQYAYLPDPGPRVKIVCPTEGTIGTWKSTEKYLPFMGSTVIGKLIGHNDMKFYTYVSKTRGWKVLNGSWCSAPNQWMYYRGENDDN